MAKYRSESAQIREIFSEFADRIEPLSLDEAYLDVTNSTHFHGSATLIADQIRRRIKAELALTASAGVAPNKFLAKIASDMDKPDGLTVVTPESIDDFMIDLPVEAIPGVGAVTAEKLHRMGFRTCGDLQTLSLRQMWRRFGKWGRRLFDLCRGVDERPVRVERIPKSLSVENTYVEDLPDADACVARIPALLESLTERYKKRDDPPPIRALFVKVKFADFRQTTLERSEFQTPEAETYERLLRKAVARHNQPVRLLGLGLRLDAERADGPVQLELFR